MLHQTYPLARDQVITEVIPDFTDGTFGDSVDEESWEELYNRWQDFEEAEEERDNDTASQLNTRNNPEELYEIISNGSINLDDLKDFATWKKYPNGFATKFLNKYGYSGGGF